MNIPRHLTVGAAGAALSMTLLFACATNVELTGPETPQPDAGPATTIAEASVDASTDAPADVAIDGIVTGACTSGGFCFQPVPIQAPLAAISGSSANDVWTVGGGAILRHRGTQWEQVYEYSGTTPESITMSGIWALHPDNVWATATDSSSRLMIVRYASKGGGSPSFYEVPTTLSGTQATWVTPAADALWAANGSGTITRLVEDGNGGIAREDFTPKASPDDKKNYNWSSLWGFAPDDVYAGGQEQSFFGGGTTPPMIAHYDGTAWTITVLPVPVGSSTDALRGTQPAGQQQLWSSTRQSSIDGNVFTASLYPIEDGGIGPAIVTNVVTPSSPCGSTYAWASSPTSAWISGGKVLCHWDGTKLEPVSTSLGGLPTGFVRGIWAASDDDVWIVGEAVPQGLGFPAGGFAAHRTKDSGASQP
jgi:hypothetical protein